jgi:hypothetical protein
VTTPQRVGHARSRYAAGTGHQAEAQQPFG